MDSEEIQDSLTDLTFTNKLIKIILLCDMLFYGVSEKLHFNL